MQRVDGAPTHMHAGPNRQTHISAAVVFLGQWLCLVISCFSSMQLMSIESSPTI